MGSQETYWKVESEEKARELAGRISRLPLNRISEDMTFVDAVGVATLKVDVETSFGELKAGDMFLVVSGERHPLQDIDAGNPLVELCGTMPIPLESIHGCNIDPSLEYFVKF